MSRTAGSRSCSRTRGSACAFCAAFPSALPRASRRDDRAATRRPVVRMNSEDAMPFQSQNRVLAGLPLSDYALLAPSLQPMAVPPGARPLPLGYVYFPDEGVMSLLAITPDGQTIEMASAGRQGLIAPITHSDAILVVALGTLRVSRISAARLQAVAAE